jgi:hypothetical protein
VALWCLFTTTAVISTVVITSVNFHHTENGPIDWVKETTYLGVTLVAGPKFKISLDNCKTNFYSSFNAIYSQLGKLNSMFVTLKLISTIALPCLM